MVWGGHLLTSSGVFKEAKQTVHLKYFGRKEGKRNRLTIITKSYYNGYFPIVGIKFPTVTS